MGTWPAFKAASFCSSLSTRMTSCPRSAKHAPATSPTYPDPTTAICIRYSGYLSENRFDNYFISFSCGGCANHLPPHWSDITPIRDDSYSFCGGNSRNSRRRSSLPQIAGFRANNQFMRLRFSLAFQLPLAENSCPSARTLTPPLSPAPKYSQSQTLPVPMNN